MIEKRYFFKEVFLCIMLTVLLSSSLLFAQTSKADSSNCLRCHAMKTLAYQDTTTGGIVSLYVNPVRYRHSVHKRLDCTVCHSDKGFTAYPHAQSVKNEKLSCLTCHQNDKKFASFHFQEKEKEFKESIHYKKLKDHFDCFSCHNPHDFNTTRGEKDVKKIVQSDNQICLNCHQSPARISALTTEKLGSLSAVHSWLPNIELHWRSVRCLECHVQPGKALSHKILPANKAVKNCESCHTKNSILLNQLYTFRVRESRQKKGFLSAIAYNSPYIIGMTRNIFFDRLSIILFGLMILGLGAHGFGRWLGKRRNNR